METPAFSVTPAQIAVMWVGSMATMVVALALLRRRKGLPVFKPVLPVVTVEQTWCSGKSSDTPFGLFGWARNCLWVVLTPDALRIAAHFPFNLFLPRFLFDLDVEIPVGAITAVTEERGGLPGDYLRVSYEKGDGVAHHFDLQVRDPKRLAAALQAKLRVKPAGARRR
jgi:hypothetical protein